jgi:transcriptional regulator with XRE-family HTH domain
MARKGYTQSRLATALGIKQQVISRRLSGHVAFTVTELDTIASVLGVSLHHLVAEAVA